MCSRRELCRQILGAIAVLHLCELHPRHAPCLRILDVLAVSHLAEAECGAAVPLRQQHSEVWRAAHERGRREAIGRRCILHERHSAWFWSDGEGNGRVQEVRIGLRGQNKFKRSVRVQEVSTSARDQNECEKKVNIRNYKTLIISHF